MLLITGPDAGRLPAYLEMNLHLGGHWRYLPATKCLNDFFQSSIRMPVLSVIMKLHNPGTNPLIKVSTQKVKLANRFNCEDYTI